MTANCEACLGEGLIYATKEILQPEGYILMEAWEQECPECEGTGREDDE